MNKRKPRPYIRSAVRLSQAHEKPKFRIVKVTDEGVRQCTVSLVSSTALEAAQEAFLRSSGSANITTNEYQIELIA